MEGQVTPEISTIKMYDFWSERGALLSSVVFVLMIYTIVIQLSTILIEKGCNFVIVDKNLILFQPNHMNIECKVI